MLSILRTLLGVLLVFSFGSCQGRGRVHEAPPPSYPAPESSDYEMGRPTPAPSAQPDDFGGSGRYANPPSQTHESGDESTRDTHGPEEAAPQTSATTEERAAPKRSRSTRGSARAGLPRAPLAEERPGLATHWGETRYSPARQVDFERAAATRPTTIVELHYDDRAGALEMLPGGSWAQSQTSALGGALRISMVDASGRPFPALRQGDRVISMGDPGERYSLVIENDSDERFEIVTTVDGLDVLDGEDGSLEKRGYLIGAYSSVSIDGFRQSEQLVAAFRLGNVARSYAASKGKARNVGVIGFAVFDERKPAALHVPRHRRQWPGKDTHQRRTAEPFPGGHAEPPAW